MNRTKKIMCGGSWFNGQDYTRAAYRSYFHPGNRSSLIGFRVKKQIKADTKQLRGGSWLSIQTFSCRSYAEPWKCRARFGFRVKKL